MKENFGFENIPISGSIPEPEEVRDTGVEEKEANKEKETFEEAVKKAVLYGLSRNGILVEKGGIFVLDIAKVADQEGFARALGSSSVPQENGGRSGITRDQVLEVLTPLSGVSKEEYEVAIEKGETPKAKPLVSIPRNEEDALRGVVVDGVLDIDILKKSKVWNREITLLDGSHVTYGEVFFAKALHDMEAKREDGVLKIKNPNTGKYETFNAHLLIDTLRILGASCKDKDGKQLKLQKYPLRFIKEVAPRLIEEGVLVESDFSSKEIVLYNLKKAGIITVQENGVMELDEGRLKNLFEHIREEKVFEEGAERLGLDRIRSITFDGIVDMLIENKFILKNTARETERKEASPGLLLPKTKEAAIKGNFDNEGLFLIEDLREYILWEKEITLEDGSTFNYAELFVAHKLKELNARRGEEGLEIFDPREGQKKFKPFSPRLFVDITGRDPSMTDKEKTATSQKGPGLKKEGNIKFGDNPILFTERYMSSLLQSGVLRKEDFKVSNRGRTAEVFRVHDQRFSVKNPYVYFSSGNGGSRYYLGKEKIVGTSIPVTEDIAVRQLDEKLIAVIDTSYEREKILRYFPLLSDDELEKKHVEVSARTKKENPSIGWFAKNTYVGGREMKERLKEYKVTDFLPMKPGEKPEAYADRVARLSDTKFVMNSFSALFRQADVGTHKLPWGEQLVLADTVMNKAKEAKLLPFVKKYKIPGLRTFLSLEYGREFGDKIVELGEKMPEEAAKAIFAKYSEIIDYASGITQSLAVPGKEIDQGKVEDRLMRKARGILVDFTEMLSVAEKAKETVSSDEVLERLNLLQGELLLTGELIKQRVVDMESLEQVDYATKPASKLSDAERNEMLAIYRQNHNTKYRGSHLNYLLKDFENKITGMDGRTESTFHLLNMKDKLGAFVSTREFGDGTLYIDDLETNLSLMGSAVGFDLFKQVTDMYPERTLTGYVWAGDANAALIRKYRQAGWVIDQERPEYLGGAQEKYFKAIRPPKIVSVETSSPLETQEAA